MYQDIKERTFKYSLRIIDLSANLPRTYSGSILGKQVLRSGTSIDANIEEAVAAYGRNDFIYKVECRFTGSTRDTLLAASRGSFKYVDGRSAL